MPISIIRNTLFHKTTSQILLINHLGKFFKFALSGACSEVEQLESGACSEVDYARKWSMLEVEQLESGACSKDEHARKWSMLGSVACSKWIMLESGY